jgi:hypothetical protein
MNKGMLKVKKIIWGLCILCAMVVVIITFRTCTLKSVVDENGKKVLLYFPKPEKILVYKDSTTQTITKDSNLFSDILIKMNSRVKEPSTAALALNKTSVDNNSMEIIKKNEIVVEFVYSRKQKLKGVDSSREYSSLIFPLTGDYYDMCFLEENKNNYSGPVGQLINIGDVLELVK